MSPSMRRAPRLSFLPLLTAGLAAALLSLAPAAGAAESPLDEYQRTGAIDPCNPGLGAGGGAPNDVQQYAPDYLAALEEARRKGCGRGGAGSGSGSGNGGGAVAPGGSGGSTSGPSGAPAGTPYVPKPPAPPKVAPSDPGAAAHLPLAVKSDGGTPAPVIALAILFLLALLGAALAATGRWFGWRLGLMDPVRHAGGEAALRMGSAAGSLADRARAAARRRR
jgi:hypothetical protein